MTGFLMPGRAISFAAVATLFLAVLCGRPASVRADVFLLANGGRVEGELLNPDQTPRKSYLVRTASGANPTDIRLAGCDLQCGHVLLPSVAFFEICGTE